MQYEISEQGYSIIEVDDNEQLQALNRELSSQVSMLMETIASQENESRKLREQSEELQKEITELKAACNSLQANLNGILASRSWVLTAPLRKILNFRKA